MPNQSVHAPLPEASMIVGVHLKSTCVQANKLDEREILVFLLLFGQIDNIYKVEQNSTYCLLEGGLKVNY